MKTFKNYINDKSPGFQHFIEFLPTDFSIRQYCRRKICSETHFAGSSVNSFNRFIHQGSTVIYNKGHSLLQAAFHAAFPGSSAAAGEEGAGSGLGAELPCSPGSQAARGRTRRDRSRASRSCPPRREPAGSTVRLVLQIPENRDGKPELAKICAGRKWVPLV